MTIENQELLDKAEELEIITEDFETDDELQAAIDEKLEDELNVDPDKLKEKLEYQKGENKKAFDARDRAKRDMRTLRGKHDATAKELKDIKEKLEGAPSAEEYGEIKSQLEEILEEREERKIAKLDDADKVKVRFEKQLTEFEKKFEATTSKFENRLKEKDDEIASSKEEVKSLRKVRLGSEIIDAAAAGKAYNPKQIEKILSSDFVYDDKLDSFTCLVRDGRGKIVDELTVEERVKAFLEDSDNDNLVRSERKGGTGTKEGASSASAEKATEQSRMSMGKLSRKAGEYDPKDPTLIEEAEFKGLTVEDHIETLKLRDEKMGKIRGDK